MDGRPKTLREKLFADAQEYCRRTGMSLARLSTVVANNGHFFERIAAGGDCTTETYERFQAYFETARRANAGRTPAVAKAMAGRETR